VGGSASAEALRGVWVLALKDELLRRAAEHLAAEELRELLLKYFAAEEVSGVVGEEEAARIDEELRGKVWEEVKRREGARPWVAPSRLRGRAQRAQLHAYICAPAFSRDGCRCAEREGRPCKALQAVQGGEG
jgi:hypothetical protein